MSFIDAKNRAGQKSISNPYVAVKCVAIEPAPTTPAPTTPAPTTHTATMCAAKHSAIKPVAAMCAAKHTAIKPVAATPAPTTPLSFAPAFLMTLFAVSMLALSCSFTTKFAYADDFDDAAAAYEEAKNAYNEAILKQEDLAAQIEELEAQIEEVEEALPEKEEAAGVVLADMYRSSSSQLSYFIDAVFESKSFVDFVKIIDGYNYIYEYQMSVINAAKDLRNQLSTNLEALDEAKASQDQAVEDAQVAAKETLAAYETAKAEAEARLAAEEAEAAARAQAEAEAQAAAQAAAQSAEEAADESSASISAESSAADTSSAADSNTLSSNASASNSANNNSATGSWNSGYMTVSEFRRKGVVYDNGYRYTWYSEKVLPGNGLNIPGRQHLNGCVCDGDGYICVASSDLPKGTVVPTPLGDGKVYDSGCASGTIDLYLE